MKKKILFIILILIVGFSFKNVNAADVNFTDEKGISYTIKGIHLDVYKSKLDNNGKFNGYINDNSPEDTINIEDFSLSNIDDDNMTNDYVDVDDGEDLTTYIYLNLNKSKDDLKDLLASSTHLNVNDNSYYVKMVVDYTINNEPPTNYTYYFNRKLDVLDGNKILKNKISFNSVSLSGDIHQVFNSFEYKTENGASTINYISHYENGNYVYYEYLFDSFVFSSYNLNDTSTNSGATYFYATTFVGIDNIRDILNDIADDNINGGSSGESETTTDIEITNNDGKGQVVPVEDTLANVPKLIIIFGSAIVFVGYELMVWSTIKKSKKNSLK